MFLWKHIDTMFLIKQKKVSFAILTKESMSVLLKKITLFVKIMLKNPSKFKRVSKMTENATHRTSNHYRFLKLDTIAFLVVYSIYGPMGGILRKTVLIFSFFEKMI